MTPEERQSRRVAIAGNAYNNLNCPHDLAPSLALRFAEYLFVSRSGDVYVANEADGSPRMIDKQDGSGGQMRYPVERFLVEDCQPGDRSLLWSAPWGGSLPPRLSPAKNRWTIDDCDVAPGAAA